MIGLYRVILGVITIEERLEYKSAILGIITIEERLEYTALFLVLLLLKSD